MISTKFREALRDAELPQYKIAWQAGIEPTVLSALLIGAKRCHDNDERIIAVGRVLGLTAAECFEEEAE